MLSREVCAKCWKEITSPEELPEVVEDIGFIDPEESVWQCSLIEEDDEEAGVNLVRVDDPRPPADCPKTFEHAVSAGMTKK